MSYRIEPISADPATWREAAEFLAAFVREGELDPEHIEGPESQASTWLRRFEDWWAKNPFCQADSPRGFLLRTPEGEIGGFQGLIPREYQIQGSPLAGLITTTLFVREAHRSSSLGLFMRVQRLKDRFYLVDATPSVEMSAILERFGYRACTQLTCRFLPMWRSLLPIQEGKLTHAGGVSGRLIQDPREVREVMAVKDGRIRPVTHVESLTWELQAGNATQHFRGWIDAENRLLAWVRLEEDSVKGQRFWRVAAYGDSPTLRAGELMDALSRHPRQAGIPGNVRFIAFYHDAREPSRAWLTRAVRTRRYDSTPAKFPEAEKWWVLRDGDSAFL